MKKVVRFAYLPILAFGMIACGGGEEADTAATTSSSDDTSTENVENTETDAPAPDMSVSVPALPADYIEHDLSEHGAALTISGPEGAYIYTSKLINNDGEQDQVVVQMADDSSVRLHISQTDKDLVAAKADVEGNMINTFKSYMIDEADGAFYYAQKSFDDSDYFNFVMVIEKDGQKYHVKGDGGMDPLTKEDALMLFAMASTLK